jgi:hypothetical protein
VLKLGEVRALPPRKSPWRDLCGQKSKEESDVKGLKSVIVISTIVAAAAALSACEKAYRDSLATYGAGGFASAAR